MRRVLPLLLLTTTFLGCAAGEAQDQVENEAVPRFHVLYDSSNFDMIYNEADPEFRTFGPKPDYDKFMAAVRRKLGTVKSTTRQSWKVTVTLKGTFIALDYKTEYEHGDGVESFIFVKRRGSKEAKLYKWQVNSTALILQ